MQKVTIKSGAKNVVLPDGKMYQAGDTAVLTDEEASQLTSDVVTNYLTAAPVAASVGDVDSPQNESTVIGDVSSEYESNKPTKDTTYG
jgi:hypothetical protein